MHSVMSARLLDATETLRTSLSRLQTVAPEFDIRQPAPAWTSAPPPAEPAEDEPRDDVNVDLLLRRAFDGVEQRKKLAAASVAQPLRAGRTPGALAGRTPASSGVQTPAGATPRAR
jgi:hypothetical protein